MDRTRFTKILAIYLPQFHETEDNNKWWGKGFTDWETVKQAEQCFDGHAAPWVPLNQNYYDLSDVETLKWQTELARKYHIDGFCIYHYYFKNGKKELERPAELLLEHPEINMPYCLNWANESWIKSWSKIAGNVWSEKFEGVNSEKDSGILVEQDYGDVQDWKEHFEYLLPFFKDERYIKINGMPVFVFYNPADIKCLDKMADLWRELAVKSGLPGLYLIGADMNASLNHLDASIVYEPRRAINRLNYRGKAMNCGGIRCFDYQDFCDALLAEQSYQGVRTYFSGVTGFDTTPRKGKSGLCLVNNSCQIFQCMLEELLIKSMKHGNELLFINAWNEWGEGMHLEPDEKNGYGYLEAVCNAVDKVQNLEIDCILENGDTEGSSDEEKVSLIYEVNKYKTFIDYYNKWLYVERQGNFNMHEYLSQQEIHTVAIYGMGMLGKQMYEQLIKEGCKVRYGIDRDVGRYGMDFKIIRPEEEAWPLTDAIIITAYEEDEVETVIKEKTKAKMIKLSEIIDYMWTKE